MDEDLSEQFQSRVTKDGVVHRWRRGTKEPPEARLDICDRCLAEGREQKLKVQKNEFDGKKGRIDRDYVCPVHGVIRKVRRQERELTRGTLKEPERRNKE